MTKAELIALQTMLAGKGLYKGGIDGLDGKLTTAAIVALQGQRGGCARRINRIVIHCSATREGQDVSAATIRKWHTSPPYNWADIGYHHVIRLSGTVEPGRSEARVGSHVGGHNADSVAIVYVGGVATDGKTAKDTRTAPQRDALAAIVGTLKYRYPAASVCGHRDLSPDINGNGVIEPFEWLKACPSFDVAAWLKKAGLA